MGRVETRLAARPVWGLQMTNRRLPETDPGTIINRGSAERFPRGETIMAHEFGCSACEFHVRSENDDELIELVQNHAEEMHDLDLSQQDVRDGWTSV